MYYGAAMGAAFEKAFYLEFRDRSTNGSTVHVKIFHQGSFGRESIPGWVVTGTNALTQHAGNLAWEPLRYTRTAFSDCIHHCVSRD